MPRVHLLLTATACLAPTIAVGIATDNTASTDPWASTHSNVGLSPLEQGLLARSSASGNAWAAAHGQGPPPPPPPPVLTFDDTLDDYAVLQQLPSVAQVYGATKSTTVTVKVSGSGCPSMSVKATVFNSTWKAKVPGDKGGDCQVVATDAEGNTANISHVTYGDVWYCGGQSNMALPMAHTFSRNISASAVMAGKYVVLLHLVGDVRTWVLPLCL